MNCMDMKSQKIQGMLLLGSVLLLLSWVGCNESPISPPTQNDYQLHGSLVIDRNTAETVTAATLARNDSALSWADIRIGAATLLFDAPDFPIDSVYSFQADSISAFPAGQYDLMITDPTMYADTLLATVPDTFSMSVQLPANRVILGNGNATLSWTGAAGTEAYLMAAVKADRAYTGDGYAVYSLTGTGGTLPADAFLIPGTPNPDTGLFNLYVYAVSGAPDTGLVNRFLPVPLPDQRTDNISVSDLTGRFGAVVVSLTDTVRVVAQVAR